MSKDDKHKRKKRQKQIRDLLVNFGNRYNNPKPADCGRLIENMMRKVKGMTPVLLEELITLQRPKELEALIGKGDYPSDKLLPKDYFYGEPSDDEIEEWLDGIRIEEVIGDKTKVNALLRDEDLEPLIYAIAYVLAGQEVAAQTPAFNNRKRPEARAK
ncbi:MAG: hypothetical protein K2Y22_14325 [Candidatus Obscuribacterales bacterium]|nr:hypothetical protein [Candidatus Obscuribacterales bacterium]